MIDLTVFTSTARTHHVYTKCHKVVSILDSYGIHYDKLLVDGLEMKELLQDLLYENKDYLKHCYKNTSVHSSSDILPEVPQVFIANRWIADYDKFIDLVEDGILPLSLRKEGYNNKLRGGEHIAASVVSDNSTLKIQRKKKKKIKVETSIPENVIPDSEIPPPPPPLPDSDDEIPPPPPDSDDDIPPPPDSDDEIPPPPDSDDDIPPPPDSDDDIPPPPDSDDEIPPPPDSDDEIPPPPDSDDEIPPSDSG